MPKTKRALARTIIIILTCVMPASAIAQVERIVSLAPSFTKVIYQLGAEDKLVGCTSFCTTGNNNHAEVVASAVSVNIEKLALLKPDIVLCSSLTPPESIKLLRKLNINVLHISYPKSFDDICKQTLDIGEAIGYIDEAKTVVQEARLNLEAAVNRIPEHSEKPSVFIQIGVNPIYTVVPNTFMNDFISYAACSNIASDLKIGSINRESIIARNPDYMFIILMGSMGKTVIEDWKQYNSLKAIEDKHIFELNADMACSPTVDDFVDILNQMINTIYLK